MASTILVEAGYTPTQTSVSRFTGGQESPAGGKGKEGPAYKHLLQHEPAGVHGARLLVQYFGHGGMPHVTVSRLDENAVHHGHVQHTSQENLVHARRVRQLGVRNLAVQRDMVGDIVTV